jgi:hypothetical protein
MTRQATTQLIEMVEQGLLSWEDIAMAALNYMSESDVKDMAECNDFIEVEDDED